MSRKHNCSRNYMLPYIYLPFPACPALPYSPFLLLLCLTSECTRDESGRLPVWLPRCVCLCNTFDVSPIVVWQHVVSKH